MADPAAAFSIGAPPGPAGTALAAARLVAARSHPYFAHALFAMQPITAPGLGTVAVDAAWRLYVDPVVIDHWGVDGLAGALLHEVGHLLRDHAGRANRRDVDASDAQRWNLACDAEINDDLLGEGVVLPLTPVTPSTLGCSPGLLAEQYFDELVGDPSRQPPLDHRDCGSVVDGRARAWDLDAAVSIDPVAADLIRRATAAAMRTRSDVPAGWQRWAAEVLEPEVDWRRALAAAVRGSCAAIAGLVDVTYRRPSRRQSASPTVVLPAWQRPRPSVSVVVDTSASVSDALLGQVVAELRAILTHLGGSRVPVLCCDAAVASVTDLSQPADVARLRLAGGGGTDLRVGIEAALGRRPRPDVLVILTDGETPWPDRLPARTRAVIGLLGADQAAVQRLPTWARTVPIRDPEELR